MRYRNFVPLFRAAAWWIWVDALVHEEVATSSSPPFKYNWPGIVATIALLLINLVSREDLAEISVSGEDGADVSDDVGEICPLLPLFLKEPFAHHSPCCCRHVLRADSGAHLVAYQFCDGSFFCSRQCDGADIMHAGQELRGYRSRIGGSDRAHSCICAVVLGFENRTRWRRVWVYLVYAI
jgi:hypothetical protein